MGEAIIARGQTTAKNVLDDVPVVQGVCSILVKVTDSSGEIIPNCPVWCKDGSTNYNYNTNAEGYTLFQCNSGAANITAQNFSILDSYNMVDQLPATTNEDAPVGTKKLIAMVLGNRVGSDVYITSNMPNIRFMNTETLKKVITIGGGAAGYSGYYKANAYGGGGGAFNEANNVKIDKSTFYNFVIGAGGGYPYNGAAGGTTSALGISSLGGSGNKGGGSGDYKGGDGMPWPTWYNTKYKSWYDMNEEQMKNNYPTEFVSNYFRNDNSNKYKNFGHGGGMGEGAYLLWCWYGYESLIARGGYYKSDSSDHLVGQAGLGASIYGSGGGGGGYSSAGWGNGSGGAGKQGVIILQF